MKILFEEHIYATSLLENILGERYFRPVDHFRSKPDYVGYYFNSRINEAVFILPKVFVYNKGKAFGLFDPEEIMDCTSETKIKLRIHGKERVIFELPVWLYQAMFRFNKREKDNKISDSESVTNVVTNIDDTVKTELDLVLGMIRFHRENQVLLTQIAKINHSQQHKIHWTKTVSKKNPVFSVDGPVYMDVVSKKKVINYDEELIVIFYSVLNYLKKKYGFRITINEQYDLITKRNFEKLLSRGTKVLKSIKYKYFSDKLLSLWKLLYLFFERSEKIRSGKKIEEVLMIKDFDIIFEDMIDFLIGDSDIPESLKHHKDGKQLDHIYRYGSLIQNDDIYFVGDSKYYREDGRIDSYSIAKQYTYAKNVIQYNIDLFNRKKLEGGIRYRDSLTEGYNITPNFFIRAFVNDDFDFLNDGLREDFQTYQNNFHFENRVFDRDTLSLQGYDINFLFVLSAYISRNESLKSRFKEKVRKKFRDRMIEYFNCRYNFYKITPFDDMESFVTRYFRLLNGKMYRPTGMDESLIVGFLKGEETDTLEMIKVESVCEVLLLM